jgi:hypothetical protein
VIARAVTLARSTTSTASIVALAGFNLVPLIGVLAWGWNVSTILVLYWVENGVVGLLNIPKILIAQGSAPAPRGLGASTLGPVTKAGIAGFFVFHYGIFWLVHGIFVFTLPLFASFGSIVTSAPVLIPGVGVEFGFSGDLGSPVPATIGIDATAVLIGLVGLSISRGVSFVVNYLGRREYLTVSPQQQAFAPYPRLVILHVTIILGAFVSLLIGSPVGAIAVLVLVKTVVDLGFHVREHAELAEREGAGPPSAAGAFERPDRMVGAQPEGEIDVVR